MHADNVANPAGRNDLGVVWGISLRPGYFILSGGTLPSRTLPGFLRVEICSAVRGRSGAVIELCTCTWEKALDCAKGAVFSTQARDFRGIYF